MQVAAILSDLKSLAACPPEAAQKLVTVHKLHTTSTAAPPTTTTESKTEPATTQPQTASSEEQLDPDLARASALITLHQSVKVKYEESGLDEELLQGREDVRRVLESL